ncbi:unnamed protein product, partial [Staurois parvus]
WAPVPPPHAAARPVNLPWAPVPTPHAAARPVICHGPLYRLLMLLPGPECVMGPCTASHCCCQARNLPWGPRTDSSCCCQARNLSWALYRLSSCCCQVQSVSWVPVNGLPLLLPGP